MGEWCGNLIKLAFVLAAENINQKMSYIQKSKRQSDMKNAFGAILLGNDEKVILFLFFS